MKTLDASKRITGAAWLASGLLSLFPCSLDSARAQSLGKCTEQVLSAPTESSVRVRLTGVNQWPVNPICFWSASGVRADGNTYRWSATLIGDGLVENPAPFPTYVNTAVIFRYEINSLTLKSVVLNCLCPYPSEKFSTSVISDPALRTPAEGANATWNEFGDGEQLPALSFKGAISLDAANNFTVDITFTGGTPPTGLACDAEVLSPPTASSVQVRLVAVQNVCNPAYASPKLPGEDPCISYPWFASAAASIPGVGSGVEVRFVYSRIDECKEIVYSQSVLVLTIQQSYLDAHPEPIRISSKENLPSGQGASYSSTPDANAPALSFVGTVSKSNGVYVVDVTFTGGTPALDVARLIAAVEGSNLPQRQKRPLLATLESARAAFARGDCEGGLNQLRAFQNKVRPLVGKFDAELATALRFLAQGIIASGCGG